MVQHLQPYLIRLPPDLRQRVNKTRLQLGITHQAVATRAFEEWLDRIEPPKPITGNDVQLQTYMQNPSLDNLRSYAFEQANGDRSKILPVIDDFIESRKTDPVTKVLARELKLPYAESEARRQNGLDYYSTDHIDEPPLHLAIKEGHKFCWEVKQLTKKFPYSADVKRLQLTAAHINQDYNFIDRAMPHMVGLDPRVTSAHFGGIFFKTIEDSCRAAVQRWLPLLHLRQIPPKSMTRRVFTGCDMGYWVKYGQGLARSIARYAGPGIVFHLHLYDPPDNVGPLKAELSGFFGENWCLTTESTGFTSMHERARLYYAAIRLARLYQLIASDHVPTIFLDTDLFVAGDMDGLFRALESRDIILCRMPGRLVFHAVMNASVCGFSGSEMSLRYLKRVTGYIAQIFHEGTVPWCLDQISLNCVLRNMQTNDVDIDAIACGPAVYNGTFQALCVPQKVPDTSPEYPYWQAFTERLESDMLPAQ